MYLLWNMAILGIYVKFQGGTALKIHEWMPNMMGCKDGILVLKYGIMSRVSFYQISWE